MTASTNLKEDTKETIKEVIEFLATADLLLSYDNLPPKLEKCFNVLLGSLKNIGQELPKLKDAYKIERNDPFSKISDLNFNIKVDIIQNTGIINKSTQSENSSLFITDISELL